MGESGPVCAQSVVIGGIVDLDEHPGDKVELTARCARTVTIRKAELIAAFGIPVPPIAKALSKSCAMTILMLNPT